MIEEKQHNNQQFDILPRPEKRARVRILQIGLALFFLVIGFRLVQIQIIESQKYREIAQRQYRSKVILPAVRGLLYDRKGNIIASNSILVSFAADPKVAAEDAAAIARKFSQLFKKPASHYLKILRSNSRFVWLERLVDSKYLKQIDLKKLNGLVVRYETKRLYYNDYLAGQLVGGTNIDNIGISGIELEFDRQLRGENGFVIFQRDGFGRARPSVDYPRVEPEKGNNIYLTIDLQIQAIAEKELRKGIELNRAERGLVIVLDPKTGEILAVAQYPHADPNILGKYDQQDQKLRAVSDLLEPGSVFKIVTASAALEYGIVKPESNFFAEEGVYTVNITSTKSRKIYDTHKEGWLTFQKAMEVSSNIVMAKVSDLIGSERFYKMARDYGFGIATNIDFPGEAKSVLKKPIEWSATTLNTMAFGYEVGVTPLQIVCAYAAVANNGILMKPHFFKKATDPLGNIISESQPQQIRRVISQRTTQTLKKLLEGVVEHGTGMPARISDIKVAGKTGTSKKIIDGHYETGNYIASFIGFFPSDDPQIVCLVMLDNPRGSSYYGGTVCAPVFRSIAEQVITTTEVMSHSQVVAASSDNHKRSIEKPKDITWVPLNQVPDVRGFSIRKAIEILKSRKLRPVVNGSGVVTEQSPAPGQPIKNGMKITLICQPKFSESLGLN